LKSDLIMDEQLLDQIEEKLNQSKKYRGRLRSRIGYLRNQLDFFKQYANNLLVEIDRVSQLLSNPGEYSHVLGVVVANMLSQTQTAFNLIGQIEEELNEGVKLNRLSEVEGIKYDFASRGGELLADSENKFNNFSGWLLAYHEKIDSYSVEFLDKANGFSDHINDVRDRLLDLIDDIEADVSKSIEAYRGLAEDTSASMHTLSKDMLLDAVNDSLSELGGELMSHIDELNEVSASTIGGLSDGLSNINDTVGEIPKIVEPIKPVLDALAAIS